MQRVVTELVSLCIISPPEKKVVTTISLLSDYGIRDLGDQGYDS